MQVKIEILCGSVDEAATAMLRLAGQPNAPMILGHSHAESQAEEDSGTEDQGDTGASDDASDAGKPKRKRRSNAQIEADRLAEAAALLAAKPAAEATEAPLTETSTAAATDAPKDGAVDTAAADAEAAAKVADAKPLTEAEIQKRRVEEVRPALQLVVNAGGNDVARAFLNDFGYPGVGAIPGDRFDDFISKAKSYAAELASKKKAA